MTTGLPTRPRAASAAMICLLACGAPAQADDGAVARCRAIADPATRLACYDAIALPATPVAAKAPAPVEERSVVKAPPAAGLIIAPAKTPAPVEERVVPNTTVAKGTEQFGLENRRPADEAQEIVSRIDGPFEGWVPNQRIRLANGQVWQIADDSSKWFSADSPKVTIWRGALGTFYMNVE